MKLRTKLFLALTTLAAVAAGLWARTEFRSQEPAVAGLRRTAAEKRHQYQRIEAEIAALPKPAEVSAGTTADDPVPPSGDPAYDERMRAQVQKVYALKHWIDTTPEENSPEFRFANDSHWFEAVGWNGNGARLSAAELRRAAHAVKESAQFNFLRLVESAMRGYSRTSAGQSPKTMSDLAPFFVCQVDEALLARYELMGADGGALSIQERVEGPGQATRSVTVNGLRARIAATPLRSGPAENLAAAQMSELTEALVKFQREHGGASPKNAEELRPYVNNPEVLVRYRPRPAK